MDGRDQRGPIVTFDHFILHESSGPELSDLAPHLARHIYSRNVRAIMRLDAIEQIEVQGILDLARDAPQSGSIAPMAATACAPRKRPCRC